LKRKFSKILGIGLTLALLCSLLLTAAPVAAISQPSVVLGAGPVGPPANPAGVISKLNTYTITLDIVKALAVGNEIVVTFPATTGLAAITVGVDADVTIGGSSGVGVAAFAATQAASATATNVLTITVPNVRGDGLGIGAGATVQLVIGDGTAASVVNPGASASYTLTVGTQTNVPAVIEAAVTSASYTIGPPTIPAVPGVVKGKNASGELLYEDTGGNAINGAIATAGVATIEVGPGTYDEDVVNGAAAVTSIKSTDGAATTIIKDANASGGGGTVTLSVKCTFDGFTVIGRVNAVTVGTVDGTTVTNCVLSGTGANPVLDINAGIAGTPTVSTGNTITVATGGVGIDVAAGKVATSTGDIISVTGTGKGVVNNGTLTLTSANISGASGIGFESLNAAAVSTISGCTLSGLHKAILVTNGTTVDAQTNTITGCGDATTAALKPAIDVLNVTTSVTIANNTIDGCVDEILQVAAVGGLGGKVFMNFNTITSPAKGIDNLDTTVKVDATNNWWGVDTGPAVTSAYATTTPFLVTPVSSGTLVANKISLTAKTTVGVDVAGDAGTANIAVASYPTFPVAAPGVPLAYSDVYVSNVAGMATVTIRLYGPVTTGTTAYAWSDAYGLWVACGTQVVNQFAGCVVVTVSAATTPTLTDLAGLPFAIADPTPTAGVLAAPVIAAPETGDDTVSLTPTLAWEAVPGADGYDFEFADNANFVAPLLVKMVGDANRLIVTAYHYATKLPYSTAYYWRVRAVSATAESPWASGVFITKAEPVEPTPPIVVEEAPPVVIEQPDIIVTLPAETPITPAWIYVIIGVGAVLVIALLVLIVRTRRVA